MSTPSRQPITVEEALASILALKPIRQEISPSRRRAIRKNPTLEECPCCGGIKRKQVCCPVCAYHDPRDTRDDATPATT